MLVFKYPGSEVPKSPKSRPQDERSKQAKAGEEEEQQDNGSRNEDPRIRLVDSNNNGTADQRFLLLPGLRSLVPADGILSSVEPLIQGSF